MIRNYAFGSKQRLHSPAQQAAGEPLKSVYPDKIQEKIDSTKKESYLILINNTAASAIMHFDI
jgi:hypothetical protein